MLCMESFGTQYSVDRDSQRHKEKATHVAHGVVRHIVQCRQRQSETQGDSQTCCMQSRSAHSTVQIETARDTRRQLDLLHVEPFGTQHSVDRDSQRHKETARPAACGAVQHSTVLIETARETTRQLDLLCVESFSTQHSVAEQHDDGHWTNAAGHWSDPRCDGLHCLKLHVSYQPLA